jgi:hypothetical protein
MSSQALPPQIEDWFKRYEESTSVPTPEKDPNDTFSKVDASTKEDIQRNITAGCLQCTAELLNGNITKQEREHARWQLSILKGHPFYETRNVPPALYELRRTGSHVPDPLMGREEDMY